MKNLVSILILRNGAGVKVDSVDVVGCIETKKTESKTELRVMDFIRIRDSVSIGIGLSQKTLSEMVKTAKEVELSEKVKRVIEWYNRALLEPDPVDRFIYLWTMMEAWRAYKYGEARRKHKKLMGRTFNDLGFKGDFEKIYELRNNIFHEGMVKEVEKYLSLLTDIAGKAIEELKGLLTVN